MDYDFDSGRDENFGGPVAPPSKPRLSNRQVLASLENLPSAALESRKTADLSNSFKILVIGSSKCGKTSLINRYVNNEFTEDYNITIGADYTRKVVAWGKDHSLRLQLWDIAGQDRFAMLTRPFFRNAHAAVIVCDVTRPLTIESVREWKRELDEKMAIEGVEIPCILLANKCDQLKGVQEGIEIGARMENVSSELKFAKWFITSAKSNENVNDAMTFLITELKSREKAATKEPVLAPRRSSLKLGNGNLEPLPSRRKETKAEEGMCSLG